MEERIYNKLGFLDGDGRSRTRGMVRTGEAMELSGERERDYMCFNDERGLEKQ